MLTRTTNPHRRGRPYGRNPFKRDEEVHGQDSSDVSNGESASRVLPDHAFHQVELSPVELSESRSSLSDDDLSDRIPPISPFDESDLDTTGVGIGEQTDSNLASSSSGESVLLESSALAACRSIAALLHRLCDKLIESIEDTWLHINEPTTDHITIQEHTNYKDTRDSTYYTGLRDSIYPINALNIQQLDLAKIIRDELIRLEYAARKETDQRV